MAEGELLDRVAVSIWPMLYRGSGDDQLEASLLLQTTQRLFLSLVRGGEPDVLATPLLTVRGLALEELTAWEEDSSPFPETGFGGSFDDYLREKPPFITEEELLELIEESSLDGNERRLIQLRLQGLTTTAIVETAGRSNRVCWEPIYDKLRRAWMENENRLRPSPAPSEGAAFLPSFNAFYLFLKRELEARQLTIERLYTRGILPERLFQKVERALADSDMAGVSPEDWRVIEERVGTTKEHGSAMTHRSVGISLRYWLRERARLRSSDGQYDTIVQHWDLSPRTKKLLVELLEGRVNERELHPLERLKILQFFECYNRDLPFKAEIDDSETKITPVLWPLPRGARP